MIKRTVIIAMSLFFATCAVNRPIVYDTFDIAPLSPWRVNMTIEIMPLEDWRGYSPVNELAFSRQKETVLNSTRHCINSEKHYKKEPATVQVARMMAAHFNMASVFDMATFGQPADYYMTAKLAELWGQQEYSVKAAVGASFGLIGAMATSDLTTPGFVAIELADISIYKADGTLIANLGNFRREYPGEFPIDAYCWFIYDNVNLRLKDFNSELGEYIRLKMQDVKF